MEFNSSFADAIMKIYQPGDIVWVHDYHLLLLPEMLRQRAGKDIYVGLFMHAPWPTSEIFKVLSRRKLILSGMLAANMVGFQSHTYKNHFISGCKRLLGYTESINADGHVTGVDTHGAHCAVEALPIGIDVEKLLKSAHSANISAKMEIIRNAYTGRQIIVGRDRLDSVRGVVQKLRAFEMFLDLYPEFVGKVCNDGAGGGFSLSHLPLDVAPQSGLAPTLRLRIANRNPTPCTKSCCLLPIYYRWFLSKLLLHPRCHSPQESNTK